MKKGFTAAFALMFLAGAAFAQSARSTTAAPVKTVPARAVKQDTTTVYDVSTTNKKGTVQYGVVEQTQTTPRGGTRVVGQAAYSDYTPSKMALANDKHAEISIGAGGSYSFNKDDYDARYTDIGLAGTAQIMWDVAPNFSMGADYMLLTPHNRNNHNNGGDFKYEKLRLNAIGWAGKLTLNAWDTVSVYLPFGVNASNVRMKSQGTRGGNYSSESKDKWGVGLFAGLGVEYTITQNMFVGLEYRYSYAFVKDTDLTRYGKDDNFQFHSAFLRVGTRF